MGLIPHANATLTAITAAGASRDFDLAVGAGSARWTGRARAYYLDDPRLNRDETAADRVTTRRLYIPFTMGNIPTEGDTVTFTIDGQTTATTAVVEAVKRYPYQAVMAPVMVSLRAA